MVRQPDGSLEIINAEGAGGGGGSDDLGSHIATQDLDMAGFDIDNAGFLTMQAMAAPASPDSDEGRIYVKAVDANNDGVFVKIKRNGGFVEVQIV